MERAGGRNAYYCPECRGLTLTINVDDGVTPMFLACRRAGLDPGENPCQGHAASLMYPPENGFFNFLDHGHERSPFNLNPGDVDLTYPPKAIDWEWYAATNEQREGREALSLRHARPEAYE
jgi:hypothetical protein